MKKLSPALSREGLRNGWVWRRDYAEKKGFDKLSKFLVFVSLVV
jgi:hypothetical protein